MQLTEIIDQLTAWFKPDDHEKRKIKGGGEWFFLSYQTIRDRLNTVCPGEWSDKYTLSHREADGDPIYFCELTICGVTHTGIGDKSNEDSPYGTPAQRSFRKAFTDAAEQFGIAAYLDEQKGNKQAFLRYLHKQGDGRAVKFAVESGMVPGNLSPEAREARRISEAQQQMDQIRSRSNPERAITDKQIGRLMSFASQTGYTENGIKALVRSYGYQTRKDIPMSKYEEICEKAMDKELATAFNEQAAQQVPA